MKIEFNHQIKGVSYGSLSGGDVFADRPARNAEFSIIYIKPASDENYAISLQDGEFLHFDDEEVVYPLDATLVIN